MTNQLRRVYPVRPERADEWLGGEIARAARDPGALGVFRWAHAVSVACCSGGRIRGWVKRGRPSASHAVSDVQFDTSDHLNLYAGACSTCPSLGPSTGWWPPPLASPPWCCRWAGLLPAGGLGNCCQGQRGFRPLLRSLPLSAPTGAAAHAAALEQCPRLGRGADVADLVL